MQIEFLGRAYRVSAKAMNLSSLVDRVSGHKSENGASCLDVLRGFCEPASDIIKLAEVSFSFEDIGQFCLLLFRLTLSPHVGRIPAYICFWLTALGKKVVLKCKTASGTT